MPADRSRAGTALAPAPVRGVPADAPGARPPDEAFGTRQAEASLGAAQAGRPSGRQQPGVALGRPQLDASALLAVWEEGAALDPARRAISLLSAAWPSQGPAQGPSSLAGRERWLHASVGQRDGWLLTLREELFGDRLETVAACPSCGAPLEVALRTGDVRVLAAGAGRDAVVRVEMDGYRVEGRPPTSADLLEALSAPDASPQAAGTLEHARTDDPDTPAGGSSGGPAALLRRCIAVAKRGDADVDPASLPPAVGEAVAQAMADADPQADVRLALDCPECGHRWSSPFDILSYLWDEIDDWAARLLREVHALASAYGWSERDILGMTARRRRLYLEMCGAWA